MLPYVLIFAGAWLTNLATVFLTLWVAHVSRTGAHPLPKLPSVTLFRRRPADDDDDDTKTNHRPARVPIGP